MEGVSETTVTFPGFAYFDLRLDDGGLRGFNVNFVRVEILAVPARAKVRVSRADWNKAVDKASLALRGDDRNSTPYPWSVAMTVLIAALPDLGIEIEGA